MVVTVPEEYVIDRPARVIEAVTRQASRYGEQVRLLEDANMKLERNRVRAAWAQFIDQLHADDLWWLARDSYNNARKRIIA